MRKLMWFALGFGSASVFGAYILYGNILWVLGGIILAVSILLFVLLRKQKAMWIAIILLGVSVGLFYYQAYDHVYLSKARSMDAATISCQIRCTDYSFDTGYGSAVDGEIKHLGHRYKVRVYFEDENTATPGTLIHGVFRFRYTSPGGSQNPTYHRGNGIFLMAYQQKDATIVSPAEESWRYIPAYLRQRLLSMIDEMFEKDVAGFVRALLLGDTTQLDYETQTSLTLSGIRHVAAVSGLHVSILFSLVYFLTGRKRVLTTVFGLPVLLLFAATAGFTPSIVRACIMQALMLLALLFDKEYDPATALSFAVIVMIVWNPQSVTSVGFQLSVSSVAGIFMFSGKIQAWLSDPKRRWYTKGKSLRARVQNSIFSSISVSLSAMVLTTPLVAFYFGAVSLVSALTNLLCLSAVTLLFCMIVAACCVGFLFLPVGRILAWVAGWIARYVLGVSSLLSGIPGSAVYMQSIYPVLWIALCYVLLAVFLLSKKKRPVVLLACVAVSLCCSLFASWAEPLLDNYRMTVLDVGQGQCILLQSGGRTYMVDCGGDDEHDVADKAAALLHSQGIYRLDGLIITHYDYDHVGAAPYLLSRIPADVLILPQMQDETYYPALTHIHKGQIVVADSQTEIGWTSGKITVFPPETSKTDNESSLCVLFQSGNCDILITGDRNTSGEISLLQCNSVGDIDILVAGHHGAKDATGEVLLSFTRPEIVVISVSRYNTFGHPSEAVLQRLKTFGCTVYRTDLQGTVVLRG